MHTWEFRLLGPLEGTRDGDPLALTAAKQRIILTALLLRSAPATVQELIEAVWDDPPEGARDAVRSYVMRLRRTCGVEAGELIRTSDSGYWVDPRGVSVDLWRFEELVRRAHELRRCDEFAAASGCLHEATGLWRFPLLENVPSSSLHVNQVPLLRERYLSAVEERIEADLRLGRNGAVLAPLRELVVEEPLREVFWHQLLVALDTLGHRAEALAQYQRLRESLVEELGVEPNAKLQALHQRLLQEDGDAVPGPGRKAAGKASPAPRQLPPGITPFVGRRKPIEEMESALAPAVSGNGPSLVLLTGPPGVGKTGLAVHVAHLLSAAFPDGQLYADLHGFSAAAATSPTTVLLRFLKALGAATEDIPDHVEERATMFRSLLSSRRVLVLLDNAATREQIEPLLPGGAGCATLVTSRANLRGLTAMHGARQSRVDALDSEEAEELLNGMLSPSPEEQGVAEPVRRLARLCGGLPLALRIAGANLDGAPESNVHDYVAELEQNDRLTALQIVGEPDVSMTIAFERSYEGLPHDARRLFRLLGLLEGMEFTSASASALSALPPDATHGMLQLLVRSHLLEQGSAGRYRLHDLLRLYAEKLTLRQETKEERQAALHRFQRFHLAALRSVSTLLCPDVDQVPIPPAVEGPEWSVPELRDRYKALEWLDTELHNVLALTGHRMGDPRLSWRLLDSLRGLVGLRLRTGDLSDMVRTGLERARASGEPLGWASMLHMRALERIDLQDLPPALEDLNEALEYYRRAEWEPGELTVYNNAGVVLAQQGDYRTAIGHFERALAGWGRRGRLMPQQAALGNLAETHLQLGEARSAVGLVEEPLKREIAVHDGLEGAPQLVTLGVGRLQLGDLGRAEIALRQALEISERLGLQRIAAEALSSIAAVHAARGKHGRAETAALRALQITHDFPHSRERVLALVAAARCAVRKSPSTAVQAMRAARVLSARAGAPDLRCTALITLAEAVLEQGDAAHAADLAHQALELARYSGMNLLVGQALRVAALAEARSGAHRAAHTGVQEAVEIHRRLGHRLCAAQALRAAAQIAAGSGQSAEATRLRMTARQIHTGLSAWWPPD